MQADEFIFADKAAAPEAPTPTVQVCFDEDEIAIECTDPDNFLTDAQFFETDAPSQPFKHHFQL